MKTPQFLLRSLILAAIPMAANAAGTYYNGTYQSPQTARYSTRGYNAPSAAGGYSQYSTYNRTTTYGQNPANASARSNTAQKSAASANTGTQDGFFVNGSLGREYAMWQFEMKNAASDLHYDNIAWNVLNLTGGYVFDMGNTKVQIDAGFKYGMQSGEATMVDDDITNGGYSEGFLCDGEIDENGKCTGKILGEQIGHAMSIGTSKSGNMLGFNMGVGLPGVFQWGNVKMTPSVGYRYFKYKLETSSNYGLAVDTGGCIQTEAGETQCGPIIFGTDNPFFANNPNVTWVDFNNMLPEWPGGQYYDTEGTYYYYQPGTSHSYEVTWAGPYVAMDLEYKINQNNMVTGRVELGFPGYTATGDQPYRFDWEHPKSVEDEAGMFSALHLGLGANWITALTDTVSLSIGVTYDYYTVSGADATTYLNGSFYNERRNWALGVLDSDASTDLKDYAQAVIDDVDYVESMYPGWVSKDNGEIDSFYRSLGVHIGISAKF